MKESCEGRIFPAAAAVSVDAPRKQAVFLASDGTPVVVAEFDPILGVIETLIEDPCGMVPSVPLLVGTHNFHAYLRTMGWLYGMSPILGK